MRNVVWWLLPALPVVLAATLAAAGCSEDSLTLYNDPPTAQIVSPAVDTKFAAGDAIHFVGLVGDPNQPIEKLVLKWISDQDGTLFEGSPDAAGNTSLDIATLSPNYHVITLQVTDLKKATINTAVTVLVNSQPTAEITSPEEGSSWDPSDARQFPVRLVAQVSDHEDTPEKLTASWASDVDGALGEAVPDAQGTVSLPVPLSTADHTLTLTVTDSGGFSSQQSVSITVNTPPTALITGPDASGKYFANNAITLSAQVDDAEDAPPKLEAVWASDLDGVLGSPKADSSGDLELVLPGADASSGRPWSLSPGKHRLTLTVTDTLGGTAVATLTLNIDPANEPPSPPLAHLEPADPGPDDDLKVVLDYPLSVDPEGEALTTTYTWYRAGAPVDVPEGGDPQRMPASVTRPEDDWEVVVTVADPYGGKASVTTAAVHVKTPEAPSTPRIDLSPKDPYTDDLLALAITQPSTTTGPYQVTYTITWYQNGIRVYPSSDPGDADLDPYTVDADRTHRDDLWKVIVQANTVGIDGVYSSSPPVEASVTILNSAPVLDQVALSPDHGTEQTEFTAKTSGIDGSGGTVPYASDLDGDVIAFTYAWTVNQAGVSPADSSHPERLNGARFNKGDVIACLVTPADGDLEGGAMLTASIQIENTAPTLTGVSFGPATAYEDTILMATATGYNDVDPADKARAVDVYHYRWYVNDALVVGQQADTLSGEAFNHGDRVYVEAVAYDGQTESAPIKAKPAITILNTPPAAGGATVIPQSPRSSDALTCLADGFEDLDDDAPGQHRYRWFVNQVKVSTSPLLQPTDRLFRSGDVVSCELDPYDGAAYGPTVSSAEVIVLNGAPSTPGVTVSPTKPRVHDPVTCSVSAPSVDPDGDALAYQFEWLKGDAVQADLTVPADFSQPVTEAVLPADTAGSAETWTCQVTAIDVSDAASVPGKASVTFLPVLSLRQVAAFTGETTQDNAGYAVAGVGDVNGDHIPDFSIGGPKYDVPGSPVLTDAGQAYVIFGRSSGWQSITSLKQADASFLGSQAGELAGQTLAGGDFNGDGLGDLIVSAPQYDVSSSSTDNGRIFILLGHTTGWKRGLSLNTANQIIKGNAASVRFGNPIATLGDINGDGLDDVAVGTKTTGEIFLLFGRTTGWKGENTVSQVSTASFNVETASDKYDVTAGPAGDVNGDGLDDLLIGAPHAAGGYGRVYLILGKVSGWVQGASLATADYQFRGEATQDNPGGGAVGGVIGLQPLGRAMDVDGDGLSDFLIGAPYNDSAAGDAGKAYLFLGGSLKTWDPLDFLASADSSFVGEQGQCNAGQTVAGIGDLDGDGFDEFLLGAPSSDVKYTDAGSVTLWQGTDQGFGRAISWTFASLPPLYGAAKTEYYGAGLAAVGDVTDDGGLDFLIAAPQSSLAGSPSGTVYLMSGP